jgi:hypothetical protein
VVADEHHQKAGRSCEIVAGDLPSIGGGQAKIGCLGAERKHRRADGGHALLLAEFVDLLSC